MVSFLRRWHDRLALGTANSSELVSSVVDGSLLLFNSFLFLAESF